jgi:cytochrome b561
MTPHPNAAAGYTPTAKLLHWLMVLLLIVQYVVAWTMPHIGRHTTPETLINLHFALGVLILAVVIIRLAWRWTHPEPMSLDGIPAWQVASARAVHGLLYVLLAIIPILGWMNASYRGFDLSFFGLFMMPRLMATRAPGFGWTGDTHAVLAYYVLLPVIGLHVLAVIYHAAIRRDRVLARMLPGG